MAAYQRGDYATAIGKLLPLAEAGDTDAEFNLGVMHQRGKGVPVDYVEAHMWFDLAASSGDEGGRGSRAVAAIG